MNKKRLIAFVLFFLLSTVSYTQIVQSFRNYKNKIFTFANHDKAYLNKQEFFMQKCYKYSRRFFIGSKLPNIYLFNLPNFNTLIPGVACDNMYGCIIYLDGEEREPSWTKCGIRIVCSFDIDSTLRLLDYALENRNQICAYKDSLLMLPSNERIYDANIPDEQIFKAFDRTLNSRKQAYIRKIAKCYNRKFGN